MVVGAGHRCYADKVGCWDRLSASMIPCASLRASLLFCLIVLCLFLCPHPIAAEGNNWTDWTDYVYTVRDDGSAHVTVVSHILADVATAEYLENRFDQNRESQTEVARQVIVAQQIAIADKLGRNLSSTDFALRERAIGNLFLVETSWTWKDFSVKKGTSWVIDVLTAVPVALDEKGNLTVTLPKSVDTIRVSLTEDQRQTQPDGVALIWKGPKANVAPVIEYSSFWDRWETWIVYGGIAAASVMAICAVRWHHQGKRKGIRQVLPPKGQLISNPRVFAGGILLILMAIAVAASGVYSLSLLLLIAGAAISHYALTH